MSKKKCKQCKNNKELGNKYCTGCGNQINKEFDDSFYNYYCLACSPKDKLEIIKNFDDNVYCPKCGKRTLKLYTPT